MVITRDRCDELVAVLDRLVGLRQSGEVRDVVVVDNDSHDGSARAAASFPGVRVLRQHTNLGAVGRTVGVEATDTDLIAFADDDSWWEPGALALAARYFAATPTLGLLHARIVVEPDGSDDPICRLFEQVPTEPGLPGPSVMGHLACGVVVRRAAYLGAGGYSPVLGFGGEERLLALDLAADGWAQCYLEDVVAHHQPSLRREDWGLRWARYRRNDTITALLRLPVRRALRDLAGFTVDAVRDRGARREAVALVRRLPAVARSRRVVPPDVLRRLDEAERTTSGGTR